MKSIGFTIGNNSHKKLPDEDCYSWKIEGKRVFACVADGITRDPKNYPKDLSFLPKNTSKDFKYFLEQYPKPSPAAIASKIFVKSSLKFLKNKKPTIKNLLQASKIANDKIGKWNKEHMKNPNYLDRDLAGCVGIIAGMSEDMKIKFLYNSDCGLAIFDKDGSLKFITEDLVKTKEKFIKIRGKIDWSNPQIRVRARKEFRNNLKFRNGECISYGAFTGEKQALSKHLAKTGSLKVNLGDIIILFSDGAREYFDRGRKEASCISARRGIEGLKKYLSSGKYDKRERTIIAIQI